MNSDEYDKMNIFDLASILQHMISDGFSFEMEVDGKIYDIQRVEVTRGRITLHDK